MAEISADEWRDPEPRTIAAMADVVQVVGSDLEGFGGFLRCETCRTERPLGSVGMKLRNGWPRCCGYTMRWWTQRQIDAGEVPGRA